MRLIGLHGKAGAGKDTAADFIDEWCQEKNLNFRRVGFADLLKVSAYRLFKPDATVEEAREFSDWLKWHGQVRLAGPGIHAYSQYQTASGRQFLQRYGTEAHRDVFDENFWVKAVLPGTWSEFEKMYAGVDFLVLTDVRFLNEGKAIQDHHGRLWHIIRQGSEVEAHASERPLPREMINVVFFNAGTKHDLRRMVRMELKKELKRHDSTATEDAVPSIYDPESEPIPLGHRE